MEPRTYPLTVPGLDGDAFEDVLSPYSGDVVGRVATVDAAGMDSALAQAATAFQDRSSWLPAFERAHILRRMADMVSDEAEALALLVAREGGKPLTDARAEIARAENGLRLCAEEATRIRGEQIPMAGTPAALGRIAFTLPEPIGVVAAVSAFNHPFNLIVHQVGPAVAAGCPVLVKPAPDTPLSCVRFIELLHEAGLPPRWAMAVPCANDVAERLVTSPQIDFFSFIGSAKVGWMLRSRLAPGVRCALEHGGVAPVIVDASGDLDDLVPLLVKGGYYHAGQVCVSVQRVFVHDAVRDEFVERLKGRVEALTVGDPEAEATEVGPLIRQGEVERVHRWVTEAVVAGATLVTGGGLLDHQCYQPTILLDPPADTAVMTQEIFGPVVCVCGVPSLDAAIQSANAVPWSFQAAVFSQDVDAAMKAAEELKGAAVMVNDHSAFRVDWMPFGGRGPSGLGTGGIGYSVRDLIEQKLVVLRVKR
ncbi:MAG: aldehyde dehydrogenase family protein [Deferrisomatales bacterium]|nr:aldehyde dehydrogenase family protein [Deferrisomatales bacterium]